MFCSLYAAALNKVHTFLQSSKTAQITQLGNVIYSICKRAMFHPDVRGAYVIIITKHRGYLATIGLFSLIICFAYSCAITKEQRCETIELYPLL